MSYTTLTDANKATVKAAILADATLAPLTSGPGTDFNAISIAMSAPAAPSFTVWKTLVIKTEITHDAGYDWTRVDNLSVGKARIWTELFEGGSVDASFPNVITGIKAVWVGTQADLNVQAIAIAHCKRLSNRTEKLLASTSLGNGADATPATLTYEGGLSVNDVSSMFLP